MSQKLSMKKNMVIFAIGIFFTKIISFFFAPLYSRYLTTAEFGIVDVLTTSASLAIPIFTLAITEAVIKYGIDDDSDLKKVFSTSFIISLFGIGLMSGFVILAGQFVYTNYIWSTLAFFASECIFLFFQAFVKAKKNTTLYVISSIIYSVFSTAMIILLIVVKDFGIDGYMIGMTAGTLAGSLFLFITCKSWNYFSFKSIDKHAILTMVKYSAPLAISNVGYWIISGSDKYVTKMVLGDEYNGYLSVIHKIPTLCTLLYTIFNYAYSLSALKDHKLSEESSEEDNKFYSKLFEYVTFLLVVGSLLVSLLSQPIVALYSQEYKNYWIFVPLYTFGVILGSFRSFYSSIYCVKEKTVKIMLVVFVGSTINAVSCYLLMKFTQLGLWATAISTIAGNLFIFAFYYFDSFKYVRIRVNWKEVLGLLCCLTIATMPVYLSNMPIAYYSVLSAVIVVILILNIKTIQNLFLEIFKRKKVTASTNKN